MSTTKTALQKMDEEQQALNTRLNFIETLYGNLGEAFRLVKFLPADQRHVAQDAIRTTLDMVHALLAEQEGYRAAIDGLQAAVTEATDQRDAALQEFARLNDALLNLDRHHPAVDMMMGEAYEQVMEEHNANFWESLPYDMAQTLGKKWQHMDAHTLYNLITLDLDDEEVALNLEGDFGWTRDQVLWARKQLLKIVRILAGKDSAAPTGG